MKKWWSKQMSGSKSQGKEMREWNYEKKRIEPGQKNEDKKMNIKI